KIIFAVSLVLNALLVGVFAGHMLGSHKSRPVTEFRDIRPEMRENIATLRARLAEIMKAENFDQAAFDAQLKKLSDAQCNFNREFMIELNEKLQKMPVDERIDAIDKMMSRKGMPHKHKRK
ncbi:MAG: periplasmic heavy metal sensor, partial [Alphaproteobacteria bacterium]|nr:periplasmic heavy metal sensor [Alphaproteobacteria bacterium]